MCLSTHPATGNVTWHVYAMTAAGLGIIYLFPYVPKIGKLIPSPLVCIIVLTAVAMSVGAKGAIDADLQGLDQHDRGNLVSDTGITLDLNKGSLVNRAQGLIATPGMCQAWRSGLERD